MLADLHLPTAFLIGALSSALAGAILLGSTREEERSRVAVRLMAGAGLLFSLALFALAAAASSSAPWFQPMGAAAAVGALLLAGEGSRALIHRPPRLRLVLAVLGVLAVMLWSLRGSGRILSVAQLLVAVIAAEFAVTLWRGRILLGRGVGILLPALLAGVAVAAGARAASLFTSPVPDDPALFHRLGSGGAMAAVLYVLAPLVLVSSTTLVLHRRSQAALEALANKDALTGLANRRVLLERGSQLNQRRRDDPPRVAVLMIDIDHFKRVNDSFGHRAGDSILQQVARTMTISLRASALLARYGGEEFGALVPVADEGEARAVAERLRAAVARETYLAEGHPVSITVSVGLTVTDLSGESFDDLLRIADRRVYRAKSNGRNQVVDSERLPT